MVRVLAAADGWIHTVIDHDVPRGWEPTDGSVMVSRVPPVELPLLFLTPEGRLATPHDDDVAWLRYVTMGATAEEALAQALARDRGALPDLPPTARAQERARAQAALLQAPQAVQGRLRREPT